MKIVKQIHWHKLFEGKLITFKDRLSISYYTCSMNMAWIDNTQNIAADLIKDVIHICKTLSNQIPSKINNKKEDYTQKKSQRVFRSQTNKNCQIWNMYFRMKISYLKGYCFEWKFLMRKEYTLSNEKFQISNKYFWMRNFKSQTNIFEWKISDLKHIFLNKKSRISNIFLNDKSQIWNINFWMRNLRFEILNICKP